MSTWVLNSVVRTPGRATPNHILPENIPATSATVLPKSRLQVMSVDSAMVDADGLFPGAAGEGNEANMVVSRDENRHRNAEVEKGTPPSKKQKSSRYKSARQKKSLSLLPTMPLDILFEIFGLLNPRDMIRLTMTSKMFRQTLLSRGTVTVWKATRERFNAPEPPHGMSEPAWVALLFGNACNNCGAKNIENIDFRLRRRLCTKCKKENLIVESRLNRYFPSLDKSLLDLIPWTHLGKWSHHYPSATRHFWVPDVENIMQDVALIKMARDGSKDNLESFKKQRRENIETIHSAATGHIEWLKKIALERQLDKAALLDERREAIYDRFIQLGYEEQDISCIKWEPQVRRSTQLTDRIWQRILPILQPKVQNHKSARLEEEYARLKGSRRVIVDELYERFRKSLPPSQWRYLPRTADIFELGPISRFINAPLEVTDTADDFKPALDSLPELLSELSDAKYRKFMNILAGSLPNQSECRRELDGDSQRVASSSQEVTCPLKLATSVFECRQPIPFTSHSSPCILVGVEDIMTHHCELLSWGAPSSVYSDANFASTPTSSVTFSRRGSETARLLVQLVGLDAKTASTQAMDDKNLRYICDFCAPETYLDAPQSRVYTWRTAIAHDVANCHNGITLEKALLTIHWKVLPDTEAEEVKERERTDGKWMSSDWTCGHCSVYMSNLQLRPKIIQHLKDEHEIDGPKEPEDLFFFERYTKPFHRHICYPGPVPDYIVPGPGLFEFDLGVDDFDASDLFRPDGDINFERDFGQWFDPDGVDL